MYKLSFKLGRLIKSRCIVSMFRPIALNTLSGIARPRSSLIAPQRVSTSAHNTFHTSPQPPHRLAAHPEPPSTSTVNDAEIAHFSRLSALWWNERGEFSLLHKMNVHRMRFIREKVLEVLREDHGEAAVTTRALGSELNRVLEGLDVLDVGCGGGILSEVRFSICLEERSLFVVTMYIYVCTIRALRVWAPIRSLSTLRRRTLASRHAMPLPTRALER
jgi:hypothetical protein